MDFCIDSWCFAHENKMYINLKFDSDDREASGITSTSSRLYITTCKQYFFETKLQSVTNFADVVSEVVVKTCLGLNTVAVWNVYLTIYLTIDPVSYILVTKPLNSFNPLLMVLNEASSISIQRLSSPVIWIRIILQYIIWE